MAGKTAILSVRILSDAKDGKRGMDEMSTATQRFEHGLDRMTVPAAAALGAIGAMGRAAVNSASELQQSTGAVASVFGDYAGEVEKYARGAAENVGLAQSQYQAMASTIGAQLSNMGIPMETVAGQTNDLVELGADLAATFGGTTADAVSALSSLLRGERDPIERYGVSMNQAAIDAQMAAMGLDGLTGQAARNAQAQATLALLTEQTSAAQGQFAREADTAAGAQQIATARYEDAKAALGEQLLPAVTAVTTALGGLAEWVSENTRLVTVIIGVIGGLAAGILTLNGIIKTVRIVTQAWTVAQRALNIVMRLNPIGLIITAIAALVAGVIYAYKHSEKFRRFVDLLWKGIKIAARWIMDAFIDIGRYVIDAASAVKDGLGGAWDWVVDKWNYFYDKITGGIQWIQNLVRDATGLIRNMFSFSMPGWMSTVGSWVGGLFSFSAPLDSAAGLARSLSTKNAGTEDLVRPAAFAPAATSTATGGAAGSPFQITVNGALDPEATARQIEQIVGRMLRRRGTRTVGQPVWV